MNGCSGEIEHWKTIQRSVEVKTKTSPTQRMLNSVYGFLDIPLKDYTHNHRRGVYIYTLYTNYAGFSLMSFVRMI